MHWIGRVWRNSRGSAARGAWTRPRVEIEPDEIFLDSSNLPSLDPTQLEGRVERPVSRFGIASTGALFILIVGIFGFRAYNLQVVEGAQYASASDSNRLSQSLIFAERGVIYDRNGKELAWNEPGTDVPYADRQYATLPGFADLIGYVRYPRADSNGTWWRTDLTGVTGIEHLFDAQLAGTNGSKLVEVNALQQVQREHIVNPPVDGTDVKLSIDADVQSELFTLLSEHAAANHFQGGAAAIMDVKTGQLLAITSFPEYDQEAMTTGDSAKIQAFANDPNSPFLFRAISGAYTPGSIVKPFVASAALNEGVIDPNTQILSTGSISVPNAYDPAKPSVFKDWRVQGWVDMRHAIAYSSDVYFYEVGGGFEGQPGLGITRLDEYFKKFGFSIAPGGIFPDEAAGLIPTPAWKAATFNGDPWRLGDTYITAIGQYGMQVSPLQAVRAFSALANGGTLLTPKITADAVAQGTSVGIPDSLLQIVREGMRLGVTSDLGTAHAMDINGIELAGKTGTAQLGSHNEWMNSWAVGFWPASHPRYAFAVVLEHAPAGTNSGASPAMNPFFYWLIKNKPQYIN
jgi:penicillin-binding protein 2